MIHPPSLSFSLSTVWVAVFMLVWEMWRVLLWASCMVVKLCVCNPLLYLLFILRLVRESYLRLITTPWPGAWPWHGAVAGHQNQGLGGLNMPASWKQHRTSQAGETSETWAHIKESPSGRRSGEASMISVFAGVWASEALSHLHLERESEGSLMVR